MTDVDGGVQKRQLSNSDDHHNAVKKRKRSDEEEEDVMAAWLSMEDETVTNELTKLLETEMSLPVKVKIVDDPHASSPLIFQSSTSYVTINGNDESCGSSFSESECSVMVGINSGFLKTAMEESGGAWEMEEARGWLNGEGINGGDIFGECDNDMLERFLGEDFCD